MIMKIRFSNYGFIYCCVFIMTLSLNCKKNNNDSTNQYTVANVSGTYSITDMKVAVNNQQTDIYSQLSTCAKKDTYTFGADGSYSFSGSTDQNCSDAADNGTWSLSGNVITINSTTNGTSTLAISSLSSKVMVVTYTGPYNGGSAGFTTTLTKQ